MSKPTLLIMAAGIGSRYGGLKQADPIGPNGEAILDYSVYDAVQAGFNKAVFVIRSEIEKEFRSFAAKRIEKMIDVKYVFQNTSDIPDGFCIPEGRNKPWGTGHAVYCARNAVSAPFALINADDYYGKESFRLVHNTLVQSNEMCMIGFKLGNTLTENGTVCRGVCKIQDGYLDGITEHTSLDSDSGLPPDTVVSMNMWGLRTAVFDYTKREFSRFLTETADICNDEFYIPTVMDNMIHKGGFKIKVEQTNEKWYGITYRADKEYVAKALRKKMEDGLYDGL